MDTVSKSGPQHRASAKPPKSFVEVRKEDRCLSRNLEFRAMLSTVLLISSIALDKCLFVKPQSGLTNVAPEPSILLQPSNLFLNFVAAVRAQDWPQVKSLSMMAFLLELLCF